jgi:predicted O-methyltransferase YrrM
MVDHEAITAVMTSQGPYGTGIRPNPYAARQPEWFRRHQFAEEIKLITDKITSIFEPRFITPPETSGTIEAIVMMTDARVILEIGTCTGFSALHILRAIIGKPGAHLTCMDHRPAHDREFFSIPWIANQFTFVHKETPGGLSSLRGQMFDLVFVDSDHTLEHCQKELEALWPITRPGTIILFHDCPQWQTPDTRSGVIWEWLQKRVDEKVLRGTCFPSCQQDDCEAQYGHGYPKECNPGLGMFIRC